MSNGKRGKIDVSSSGIGSSVGKSEGTGGTGSPSGRMTARTTSTTSGSTKSDDASNSAMSVDQVKGPEAKDADRLGDWARSGAPVSATDTSAQASATPPPAPGTKGPNALGKMAPAPFQDKIDATKAITAKVPQVSGQGSAAEARPLPRPFPMARRRRQP